MPVGVLLSVLNRWESLLFTPKLYFLDNSLSTTVERIIAPVSFARTSAPNTLGFDETRARVASKSALFNDGGGEVDIVPSKDRSLMLTIRDGKHHGSDGALSRSVHLVPEYLEER